MTLDERSDEIAYMLDCVINEAIGLTEWEESFIASIEVQFDMEDDLSNKQMEILKRIYTEKV
jgi:hypothetical protein